MDTTPKGEGFVGGERQRGTVRTAVSDDLGRVAGSRVELVSELGTRRTPLNSRRDTKLHAPLADARGNISTGPRGRTSHLHNRAPQAVLAIGVEIAGP